MPGSRSRRSLPPRRPLSPARRIIPPGPPPPPPAAARRALTLPKPLLPLKDEQAIAMLLKMTPARTVQDEAVDAIAAVGTPAEEPLRGILPDASDAGPRQDALLLLAKM